MSYFNTDEKVNLKENSFKRYLSLIEKQQNARMRDINMLFELEILTQFLINNVEN